MAKSLSQLREQLSAIEPDQTTYESIGPAEVELLEGLLDDEQDWLAARAVHALSRIDTERAHSAVVSAAQSPRMEVRVAAAVSAAELPAAASDEVLSRLLSDSEAAVRKFAIRATSHRNSENVRRRLTQIAASDADSRLRQAALQQAGSVAEPQRPDGGAERS